MSQLSFAYVPPSGFAAFHANLNSHPWTLVDSSAYDDPTKPLWDASPLVLVKIRIQRAVHELLVAIAGAFGAKGCDRTWDNCQKQLNGLLGAYGASSDPAKRDAAKRLQSMLLLGAGIAQTLLRYQEEVDHGRKQMALIATGQGAADVALLGLGPMMNEIALATETLASVIGYGATIAPPHARRTKAVAACAATFASAAESLEWMIECGGIDTNREIAVDFYASLKDVASRYPAPARALHTAALSAEAPPPSVH